MKMAKKNTKIQVSRENQLKEFVSRVIDQQQKELKNSEEVFFEQIKLFSNGKKIILCNSK